MSLLDAIALSASGLTAQQTRIESTVSNIANARTTRTAEGGAYRRRDVVFESVPLPTSFSQELSLSLLRPEGVQVAAVLKDPSPPQQVYDPKHPDADENGYVGLPNVNPVEEIVNLVSAARSFEANLTAISITRELVERSIELGRA